jgi:flagellar protein FlbT
MALKITLKPNEKMIVSGAVVTNGNSKNTDLIIENNVPVLRQKDILSEKDATTACSLLEIGSRIAGCSPQVSRTHQSD